MFERQDEEDIVERVIRELRRPASIDRALDARVMSEIARPETGDRKSTRLNSSHSSPSRMPSSA